MMTFMRIPQLNAEKPALGACQVLGRALVAAVAGLSAASPLTAQPLQLTPLVTPSSQEHHVGKVVLVQLVTPDLMVAKRFYGGLFGWHFRDIKLGGEDYAEASLDGQGIALTPCTHGLDATWGS
jgi:hypothetical protein